MVACGTGIEQCSHVTAGADQTACAAGTGDPNEPTLHIPAGLWLSLAAKIDFAGTLEWQRADQYRPDGDAVYTKGTEYTATRSSASEWVLTTSDGTAAFVNDETNGYGLMVLAASQGGAVSCVAGST